MNTKVKLIAILVLGILIVLLGITVLLIKQVPFGKKTPFVPGQVVKPVEKFGAFVEVVTNENGFKPVNSKVKKDGVIHFINKTLKTLEVIPEGENKIMVRPISAGKTTVSFVLSKKGIYRFSLKSDPSKKGSVSVE